MTLSLRVEELMKPSATLYPYFALDGSALDGTDVLAPETVLTDITSDVRSLSLRRGKRGDLDDYQMGEFGVSLNNDSRKYDPTNTASVYYGNIAPMRQMYMTAVLNGVDYPLMRAVISRWTVDYSEQNLPLAGAEGGDALLLLGRAQMSSVAAAYSGDLAGARVSRVLDLAQVLFPTDIRSIAAGKTAFGATTLGEEGGNALRYLQLCAKSEGGALYVSKTGVLTFEERNTTFGASMATFADDGSAGAIPYLSIQQDSDTDLFYNRVVCSGTSATQEVATDTVSIADNRMVSTLDRTGQLALNDADMLDQAKWLLYRYGTPETRLSQVKVRVTSLPDARIADLLTLELTDRVTVTRTPPGGGTPSTISQQAIVIGIDHDIAAGATDWICTVTFSAGSRVVPFTFDDTTFGVLDTSVLSY